MSPRAYVSDLSKGDRAAINAVKFCLLKGNPPFRVDIQILVRLVEAAYQPEEPKS